MARLRSLAILARRHPDAVEWALGAAAALAVVGVSLSQWGWTEAGLSRGVSLGLPTGLLTVWVYRRRRRRDEIREQAQIEGRLGLARELHDAVAGQVAMMGIQAAAARRVLAVRPDDAATALERIEDASRAAVGDLRRMLDTLRGGTPASTSPATPGLAGLGELVAEMERAGLSVDSRIEATDGRALPAALDHAAYRIVQESLTNALKHGAGTAQVQVRRGASDLEIRVINPIGPRRAAGSTEPGHGLVGLRERAAMFGGDAFAGPGPNHTWLVDVHLALPGGPDR